MTAKCKFILVASLVFGADLLSKHLVGAFPSLQGRAIIPDCVHISWAVNSGIFFRLLDELHWAWKPYLLAGLSLTMFLAIIWWNMRSPFEREPPQTALALLAGGLLGNSADRILYGGIIDFIEVHFEGSMYYPTFNLADLAITGGIVLLLAHLLVSSSYAGRRRQSV